MLTKSCFGVALITTLIPVMAHADAVDVLKNEYKTAVMQHIGENHSVPMVSFLRRGNQDNNDQGADFVYLWHGSKQKTYDLINIVGMAISSGDDVSPMYFSGVDTDDFTQERESTLSDLLMAGSRDVKEAIGVRRQLAIGYDLGVAPALASACANNIKNVALDGGGLYVDTSCSPSNMSVIYAISNSDSIFPIDKSISFESKLGAYSTKGRLDGKNSVKKLVKILGCVEVALQSSENEYDLSEYTCDRGNKLTVVTYKGTKHQWFGYKYASSGALNQHGAPSSKSMSDWLSSELKFN